LSKGHSGTARSAVALGNLTLSSSSALLQLLPGTITISSYIWRGATSEAEARFDVGPLGTIFPTQRYVLI